MPNMEVIVVDMATPQETIASVTFNWINLFR